MADKLNLTLPPRESAPRRSSKTIVILLIGLLLIGIANLLLSAYKLHHATGRSAGPELAAEKLQDLALQLEKQEITAPAVQAWQEYLARADAPAEERAKIWYRIGKLYQQAGDHEQALAAFYRSEKYVAIPALTSEINTRVAESLTSLGKFAALRYELADRVTMETAKGAGDAVLAEIGAQKITKSALDRRVEEMIDEQLTALTPLLSAEEKKARKESLLQQYSTASVRQQVLSQLVAEEVLYRKAVEDKLADDPGVRKLLQATERSLLAQQVMERELADQIKITPDDLETYYKAHQQEYTAPARAKISHILVRDQETAAAVLKKLRNGARFADLVQKYSLDVATRDKQGEVAPWIEEGGQGSGIGNGPEMNRLIFATEAGLVVDRPVPSAEGFHIIKVREKEKSRPQTFAEVREQVYRTLRARKENEVRQALYAQLKERYNVAVHTAQFSKDNGEKGAEGGKKPASQGSGS
jgi:parvulin-like peptidyl-prolyl isomerase